MFGFLSLNNQGSQDLSIKMSDFDGNAPSEGSQSTLEDLMKAAIADANKEKVVSYSGCLFFHMLFDSLQCLHS